MGALLTTSAPGSIMITGEHAVVYGHPAIVAAIAQRVEISAEALPVRNLEIHSEIAPHFSTPLDAITPAGPLRFVLSAAALYADHLPHGLRLTIRSQIDPTLGLGSSAAVTIAALGLFARLIGLSSPAALHSQALGIIRAHQGRGSGADLAASLKGGMLAYCLPQTMLSGAPPEGATAQITPLPAPPALSLKYCGYKTPTGEVLAGIAERMRGRETEFDAIYNRMGASGESAISHAKSDNWAAFARDLRHYQELMRELGVSDQTLDQIIAEAAPQSGVLAAKISGSGLGDCVLALGATPIGFSPAPLASKGLLIHD